jgi:hypothetical protein
MAAARYRATVNLCPPVKRIGCLNESNAPKRQCERLQRLLIVLESPFVVF